MALLPRTLAARRPPAGILPSRRQAHPALLRMLSRARRRQTPLLLVRIAPGPEAAGEDGHLRFLEELAAELRISDLAWWEPGGVVLALLEESGGGAGPMAESAEAAEAVITRLERRARLAGARPRWRTARFPQQGLTLQALLEEVQWAER